MHRAPCPAPRHRHKTGLTVALCAVVLSMSVAAVSAGSFPGQSIATLSQAYVPDAAKYGFNPQPEPPLWITSGLSFNSRMFNPQPEPPIAVGALQAPEKHK